MEKNGMEVLYSSRFQKVSFDQNLGIYKIIWYSETEEMTDEDYMEDYRSYLKAMDWSNLNQQIFLIDLREFHFVISPELQEWHNLNVFKKHLSWGNSVTAILVNGDFIADLSVEQTFEEVETLDFDTKISIRYFDDESEALEWLLNQQPD